MYLLCNLYFNVYWSNFAYPNPTKICLFIYVFEIAFWLFIHI